jgi:Ni/Co efflux regulator RcnB
MLRLILLTALLLALVSPALAKDKDNDKTGHDTPVIYHDQEHDKDHDQDRDRDRDDHGSFNSAERNTIRAWLQDAERQDAARHPTTTGLPPGPQKKVERGKALPPGWQKKLARGEHLDYEYYRSGRALPDDLLRRLPPPPVGSEILQIENQIIRLDAATRTILDVFGLGGN